MPAGKDRKDSAFTQPMGVVELITERLIRGWVLCDPAVEKTLVIKIGDVLHQITVHRTERGDVARAYGEHHRFSGFEGVLPSALGPLLMKELANGSPVIFQFGEARLTVLETATAQSRAQGHIDRVDPFCLHGWAVSNGRRPQLLALRIGEHELPLRPIWLARQDVVEALGLEPGACVGFMAELPGCIWMARDGGAVEQPLTLKVLADGEPIGSSIELSSKDVVRWIEAVCQSGESQQWMLCALEHLHHVQVDDRLGVSSVEKILRFAGRFGLQDYVNFKKTPVLPEAADWATHCLWEALRELNSKLDDGYTSQDFWEVFVATKSDFTFGVLWQRFCDSLVPTLCRLNLYERLLEFDDVDFDRWRAWESASDAWFLTIAVPAWLAAKRVDKAADILWRLTQHLDRNWLNTECLAYASREVMRRFLAGQIDHGLADKFIYAYLGVLDAFKGDWHSRLYDHQLVTGALTLLDGFDRYADFLRNDLVRGLLRHYGLQPYFWEEANRRGLSPEFALWDEARRAWRTIYCFLKTQEDTPDWTELIAALRCFDRLGNPEARRFAREIMGPQLEALNANSYHPARVLLDFLVEEPSEAVRYAAFPLVAASAFHERYPACGTELMATLRGLTQRAKDHRYGIHRAWGARVADLACLLRRDVERGRQVAAAMAHTLAVETRHGDLRAADLLSWLLAHPALSGTMGTEWHKAIFDALLSQKNDTPVAAPLQAALARLLPMLLTPVAERVRAMAAGTFGNFLLLPPREKRSTALRAEAGAWPGDTLVVIYSCRKYLDSRINAIRATWGKDLVAWAVPYLILVGEGDGRIEGDVLALDVSDNYESLPQKTLKLIEWVYGHTDFQYLYKIDDDCYLDVRRLFGNLSYRGHHYYGRIIRRGEGSMDRAWHQSKSQSEYARLVLDKSPEPSVYADGGGGYALSRFAMKAAQDVVVTDAGQRLVAVSFMEDKLVGDLLALAGIVPSDEEYESYQRRRTSGAAVPVGMWENLFFPGEYTPTVMCHLDAERDQAAVHARRESKELWPKKVWPTCGKTLVDRSHHPNQLELISSAKRLRDVLAEPPHVMVPVRNEKVMLPHFLAHYRRLGAGGFLIADNCSEDGTREYLLEQPDVALFSVDTEYRHSHYGVAWQQALLGNFCIGRWVVLADADEFLVYPDCENRALADFLAEIEREGADAVRIGMVDMYPFGSLDEANIARLTPFEAAPWFDRHPLKPWRLGSGYYSNSVSYVSALRHRLDPQAEPNAFTSVKTALVRYQSWMHFSRGLHDAAGVTLSARWAWFAHFKYHAGFAERVRTEIRRGQHFSDAKEYRRYQAMLAKGNDRFYAQGMSVRFENSTSFDNLPNNGIGKTE